jgi:ADP-heptose:LPS heptosyltransferase
MAMNVRDLARNTLKRTATAIVSAVDATVYAGKRPSTSSLANNYLLFDLDAALGFVVMNSAAYEAIKRAHPSSRITVACGSVSAGALLANPYVDELINLGNPTASPSPALARFIRWRMSTATRADIAIINCSTEKFLTNLLVLATGPVYRVGKGSAIYDRVFEATDQRSVLENVMGRLECADISDPIGQPRIYFNASDLDRARQLLSEHLTDAAIRVAYVTQTSGGHPNEWWDDRFVTVADAIGDLTGAPAIFLGTGADVAAIEGIRRQMKTGSVSIAGKTNLRELAALIAQCELVVSLDTGTLHVTRGAGTPAVVIAPAHQPRHEWLPINNKDIVILRRDDIHCRECRLFHCSTRECMDEINAEEVVAAAARIVRQTGADLRAREQRVANSLSDRVPSIY